MLHTSGRSPESGAAGDVEPWRDFNEATYNPSSSRGASEFVHDDARNEIYVSLAPLAYPTPRSACAISSRITGSSMVAGIFHS